MPQTCMGGEQGMRRGGFGATAQYTERTGRAGIGHFSGSRESRLAQEASRACQVACRAWADPYQVRTLAPVYTVSTGRPRRTWPPAAQSSWSSHLEIFTELHVFTSDKCWSHPSR